MKVEINRVTKAYGNTRALDDLSLILEPGKVVALLGANGAGKSTLLRTDPERAELRRPSTDDLAAGFLSDRAGSSPSDRGLIEALSRLMQARSPDGALPVEAT